MLGLIALTGCAGPWRDAARPAISPATPAIGAAAPPASAPAMAAGAADLVVRGIDGRERRLEATRLAALPRQPIEARLHDVPHRYAGIALSDVLAAAEAEVPEASRGPALRRVLLLRAADGYAVAFSAGELDPSIGNRRVWIVDRVDDRPLPADEGPWRLVVPGEGRPTRWLRQLVAIEWHVLP